MTLDVSVFEIAAALKCFALNKQEKLDNECKPAFAAVPVVLEAVLSDGTLEITFLWASRNGLGFSPLKQPSFV